MQRRDLIKTGAALVAVAGGAGLVAFVRERRALAWLAAALLLVAACEERAPSVPQVDASRRDAGSDAALDDAAMDDASIDDAGADAATPMPPAPTCAACDRSTAR